MRLPISREEFFDLFAAYNGALWPAVVTLWVASVPAGVWLLSSRRSHHRWISGLLAVFFTRVNPAAWLFAAIFLLQAALFFWSGVIRGHLSFMASRTAWTPIGWLLVTYALTDTLHLAWAMVNGLFFLLAIGFGAAALEKRFRV